MSDHCAPAEGDPTDAAHLINPTDPDNAKLQFVYDGNWWSANYTEVNQQYLDTAAG